MEFLLPRIFAHERACVLICEHGLANPPRIIALCEGSYITPPRTKVKAVHSHPNPYPQSFDVVITVDCRLEHFQNDWLKFIGSFFLSQAGKHYGLSRKKATRHNVVVAHRRAVSVRDLQIRKWKERGESAERSYRKGGPFYIASESKRLRAAMSEVLIPFINALIVLDADGERLLAKYYDQRPKAEQTKLEQFLHKKTKSVSARSDTEVRAPPSLLLHFLHPLSFESSCFCLFLRACVGAGGAVWARGKGQGAREGVRRREEEKERESVFGWAVPAHLCA